MTRTPSPIITRGNTELPSPARGEGIVTSIALALISHDVKQPISFPRRMSAPGLCNFASPTRIEGWAERRETFGCSAEHPLGLHITRQARRLRGALRPMTRDARLSALHRGRFGLPGPRFRLPSAPAVLQRRTGALRIRAASSSHPGRSAWRAGSLPPGANGYSAGRHASLRIQDRL